MTSDTRPNILIVHADQHRADCVGAYGNDQIMTPHIDHLADDGVRFDRCYCPFPVCTPSRYSMISGLYVHEHRGATNHSTMIPGTETFPRILTRAGYRTAAVGKMHYTPTYYDVGFQEMTLAEQDGPGRWDDDYHRWLREEELVDYNDLEDQVRAYREGARDEYWQSFGALVSNLDEAHHSTTWIAERAMDTIRTWDGGGNMLMVGFVKPHHPFDPPARWADLYSPGSLGLLPGWSDTLAERDTGFRRGYFSYSGLTPDGLRRAMAGYYATISQIDYHVGRMVEHLKQRDLYDDTLIICTSDHGEYLGYHHLLLKGNHMYEPLARIPLIIKWPHSRRRGQASGALISNLDLAPTILKASGCAPDPAMQGFDLDAVPEGRDVVYAESGCGAAGEIMVRSTRHKLLYRREQPDRSLLFDLERDPLEFDNRWADPDYTTVREYLVDRALAWYPSKGYEPYLDERAPRLQRRNVPDLDDGHREAMSDYYQRMMTAAGWPAT